MNDLRGAVPTHGVPLFILHWNRPEECLRTVKAFQAQGVPLQLHVIDIIRSRKRSAHLLNVFLRKCDCWHWRTIRAGAAPSTSFCKNGWRARTVNFASFPRMTPSPLKIA